LDAVCEVALAKRPADRFPSMLAFADALGDHLRGRLPAPAAGPAPEPDPELDPPTAAAEKALDEQDAAELFRVMAAKPTRSLRVAAPRRRRRFRLPEWPVPLAAATVALGVMGWVLWSFFQYLDRRGHRPEGTSAVRDLDPVRVAEEQARLRESQALDEALARWRANPTDLAARQELDGWLNTAAGRRADLPPEVNFGLGCYLILERDRWDTGLYRLLLSADGPWRRAAEQELAAATATADAPGPWVACGDGWWQLADGQTGAPRQRLLDRAVRWYKKALPQLRDSEARRVRARIQTIESARVVNG
jgi:hypothetical protein